MIGEMPKLNIGELEADLPIVQGGMGVKVSGIKLASSVAKEGGIGIIATPDIGANEPDYFQNQTAANERALRKVIRGARELTDGLLGVNIMKVLTDYVVLAKTAIEEGINFIFCGAGLAFDLPEFLSKDSKTKLVPIVSSGRAAVVFVKKWFNKYGYIPDAFVVEGPRACGHLGFRPEQLDDPRYALENLVVETIELLKPFKKNGAPIPVIAAGGIYTGADIRKFINLGAAGVQMATRFVTTFECDVADEFKQAYIDAREEDIVIIKSPVGMPGRAIRNKFLDDVSAGKRMPIKCPFHCLESCDPQKAPYCISLALINAQKGRMAGGFAFAGANAYRSEKIISVHELIETLKFEYWEASMEEGID